MAKRIDGKVISKQIKDELKEEVAQLKAKGIEGSLAVIHVVPMIGYALQVLRNPAPYR